MSRIEHIEKLLAAEPQDVFLNFSLAMEYVAAGRPEQAVAQFERVCRLDANYVAAYFQRARTLIAMGRTQEAKDALTEGITAAKRVGDKHAASEMSELLAAMG